MVCSQCDELRTQVKELEHALDHSIYVRDADVRTVADGLGLPFGPAHVVAALWRARRNYLTRADVDALIPTLRSSRQRIDPDFRSPATIGTWVWRIRDVLGKDFIETTMSAGGGYRLSTDARRRVGEVLACA